MTELSRDTAEIVLLLAQAAEHLANGAAGFSTAGRGHQGGEMAKAAMVLTKTIATLLQEPETAAEVEAEPADAML